MNAPPEAGKSPSRRFANPRRPVRLQTCASFEDRAYELARAGIFSNRLASDGLALLDRNAGLFASPTSQQCGSRGLPSAPRYGKSRPLKITQDQDAMPNFFGQNFKDRQTAAAEAKKALAAKFLSKPPFNPEDPAYVERQKQRRAIIEAREEREAQRAAERAAKAAAEAARRAEEERRREAERLEQERLAAEARKAEEELRELQRQEEAKRKAEIEAQKKAERDARYAARKARKAARKAELKRYY